MYFTAVAFTTKETNELFLTISKSSDYDHALYEALINYGVEIPAPEQYEQYEIYSSFHDEMDYMKYCKMICDISEIEFKQLRIEVKY